MMVAAVGLRIITLPSLQGRDKGWVQRQSGLDAPNGAFCGGRRRLATLATHPSPSLAGRGGFASRMKRTLLQGAPA